MHIPEAIWRDRQLDIWDKLIIGIIKADGGNRTPGDIAQELGTSKKRVTQKINRLSKDGYLLIAVEGSNVHMEVAHGI